MVIITGLKTGKSNESPEIKVVQNGDEDEGVKDWPNRYHLRKSDLLFCLFFTIFTYTSDY